MTGYACAGTGQSTPATSAAAHGARRGRLGPFLERLFSPGRRRADPSSAHGRDRMERRTFIKRGAAGTLVMLFEPRVVFAHGQSAGNSLADSFVSPPLAARARPHTWWHWMNGNVTADGITRDLEALARIGVGGVQMFDVGTGIPKGPVATLSPAWIELVRHAAREANRLGLSLTMHNCPGRSSSGGPWVTPFLDGFDVFPPAGVAQLLPSLPRRRARLERAHQVGGRPHVTGLGVEVLARRAWRRSRAGLHSRQRHPGQPPGTGRGRSRRPRRRTRLRCRTGRRSGPADPEGRRRSDLITWCHEVM